MRVICPNCDRKGLIDAGSLSDLAPRAVCPRCGAPFRAVPSGFESAPAATAAERAPGTAPAFVTARVAPPRAPVAPSPRAATRAAKEDVLTLPRFDARDEARACAREDGACAVLDIGDDLFARGPRARPRAASDNYARAVRVMNVSPLWMLAACAGFFALVFVFDLLLTPAPRAGGDPASLASLNNQATNRDAARRARASEAQQSDESAADEADRDDDDAARTGYDEGAPADAQAQADRSAPKRAPVSDAPTDLVTPPARAAAVSFANAGGELPVGSGVEAQPLSLTIQLGSFRVAAEAEAQATALRAAGFDARVEAQQNSKRPWYCVQTGLFAARGDAERHLAGLRAKGFASSYTLKEIR
ncbi:MAG TPA: SPOR domain-containing protein [Pyrinomonadaceae bacterium]|jgi:cell division protein FtsN